MLDKAKNRGEPTTYLRNVNVRWGSFDLDDLAQMRMTPDERGAFDIRDGDVLVCEGGEPGRAAVWRGGSTAITYQKALMRLRSAGVMEPDLLQAFLRHAAASGVLSDHFTGTTIKHLPQNALRQVEIPLPPLAEQWRIVAKLDALTARTARARADLDRIPTLAARYRRAVFAAAFRGQLTRARPGGTGTDLADAQESSGLFSLPRAWRWQAASAVVEPGADIVYGIIQPGPKLDEGVPYIRGTDIQGGKILVNQLLKTSPEIAARYERSKLRAGDVILGIIRATKVAVVPNELEGGNITQGTARFRPGPEITTDFLALWLEGPDAQDWLHRHYRGIDMPGLNLGDVRRLPVPIPPKAEQGEIVRALHAALGEIDRLTAEAAAARRLLDRLDQAILAKAFRGELVSQDPADEPASALLDRIRAERAAAPKAKRGRKAAAA